jgi:HK97 family phage prohead protease
MKNKSTVFDAHFDIKKAHDDGGRWIIEGYATTADLDVDDGYITEEALRGAEKDLLKYSTLLYNHDRDKELGKVLETKYIPEERALWIKALISKTAPDVWQRIKEGVLTKFSINGRALDWEEVLIKGMDKVITFIKSLSLFEASLVTVPADVRSETLAWYVERSIKNLNSKEDVSMTKKKEVTKEAKAVGRDKERVESLISSVEEALNTEDQEIRSQALRGMLDFLNATLETEFNPDEGKNSERGISKEDLKIAVTESVSEAIEKFSSSLESIVESTKTIAEGVVAKANEETLKAIEKEEEEEADDKKEKTVEKAKDEEKEDVSSKVLKAVADLKKFVSDNVPIRRAEGAENHKEDDRKEKPEEDKKDDVAKTLADKTKSPSERLHTLIGSVTEE